MTHDVAVRPARVDDLGEIVNLRLALLREYADSPLYANLRPDAADRARELYFAQLVSPNESIFIAERRGGKRIVGILRCVDTASSPLLLPERYCYVSSVYVVPEERRQGVLRALLAAAERWCADRDLSEIRLHNAGSSPLAAEVWQSLGFEMVEEVRRRVLTSPSHAAPTVSAHAEVR